MANRLLYLVRHGEAIDEGELSEAGRAQATLLGDRLREVPLAAIHHSPLPRAAQTAALISHRLAGVPAYPSDVVGDYPPPAPERGGMPRRYAEFLAGYTAAERAVGARLAAQALRQFALPAQEERRELIVTHSFLIGWFVRHALDAPDWRWMGLNAGNCALTIILYRDRLPPTLISYNDMEHLPPSLRWTGFPPDLRP